ncbi:HTH-like domain-containing protein [Planktotalea sp.]|uniref:HTH-like domain-containing protein n=1 Tax=Planktotalea sp. TaxID=2029877 RepID=UPI003D6B2B07
MTHGDLVAILTERYSAEPSRGKALEIHLFGIEFSDELHGQDINLIAESATGKASYGTEIRKGMKLAKYVILKA